MSADWTDHRVLFVAGARASFDAKFAEGVEASKESGALKLLPADAAFVLLAESVNGLTACHLIHGVRYQLLPGVSSTSVRRAARWPTRPQQSEVGERENQRMNVFF